MLLILLCIYRGNPNAYSRSDHLSPFTEKCLFLNPALDHFIFEWTRNIVSYAHNNPASSSHRSSNRNALKYLDYKLSAYMKKESFVKRCKRIFMRLKKTLKELRQNELHRSFFLSVYVFYYWSIIVREKERESHSTKNHFHDALVLTLLPEKYI